MKHFDPPLSPAGEARRDRILTLALDAAARRRRRRHVGRAAAAAIVVAIATSPAWWPRPTAEPARVVLPAPPTPAEPPVATVEVLATPGPADAIELIGDNELLDLLASRGRPIALIDDGDEPRLIVR